MVTAKQFHFTSYHETNSVGGPAWQALPCSSSRIQGRVQMFLTDSCRSGAMWLRHPP